MDMILDLKYEILEYFHLYDLLKIDYFYPHYEKKKNDNSLDLYLTMDDLIHWILSSRMDILYKIYVLYRNGNENIKYENILFSLLLLYGKNEMIEYYFQHFPIHIYTEESGIYSTLGLEMMIYELRNENDLDIIRMRYQMICSVYMDLDGNMFQIFMKNIYKRRNFIDYRNKKRIEINILNKMKQLKRENRKTQRIYF
jgi:hypothetical protein